MSNSVNTFINLHLHSEYSMRDAVSKIKDIVAKVKEQGAFACALTDHGNMHGCIEFYKECKKQGIVPILGCEMYVLPDKSLLNDPEHKHDKHHIIFLAKDSIGYHQIADCVSRAQLLKDKKTYPRTTHEDIKEIFVGGHVICLSGCVQGEMAKLLRNNDFDGARKTAEFYRSVFGDDYYFEVQDHNLLIEMEYLDKLIELGYEMNIPLVATNDCHYVNKEDVHTREMIVALRRGDKLDEVEKDCGELYMKDYGEMLQLFGQWPETIENTVKIANKCHIDGILVEGVVKQEDNENGVSYIITDVPETLTFDGVSARVSDLLKCENINDYTFVDKTLENNGYSKYILTFNKFGDNFEALTKHICEELGKIVHVKHFPKFHIPAPYKNDAEYIRYLTYANLDKRYPKNKYSKEDYQKILDRVEYELGVICDLHYDGYLLIVQDFINAGKKIGMIGPGRGSAVGSIVCYSIGITNVDPLPYNLIFERFLNKDRVSDPDIDTDFAPMIRDLVIDYVKEVYGENSVCQIITFGTLGARASIRNAGRVHGLPINFCDRISKMVPTTPGITLDDAINGNEKKEIQPSVELANEIKKDKDVRFLIEEAKKIEGLTIQTGVHAAGVIIADQDVSKYCPMFYDVDNHAWITQYEKNSCEHDVGLLKMDFLGLENLNIITRTLQDIEKNHGIKLTVDDIDLNNEEEVATIMREIFEKGNTKGVFQFESVGMVNYLKKLKPKKLEDLILMNAAYRPGPMQYIDSIIEIRNGRQKESYICDAMRNILHVTFSKPIYQEQIQQIFHEVAGFTLGEADIIRRAMAKKKLKELEKYFPLFKTRLLEQGVAQEDIDAFCNELIDFAKYAFNKSHATAYTVVAYQTAWLKYYYPVEYMANLLTSATVKTLPVYINECKSMGIEVLPPNINVSNLNFTPTKENSIRFGLKVKGVGSSSEDIIKDREQNGPYTDIVDFINRMMEIGSRATHSNVLEAYIMSGAFDTFGYNRHQLYDGMINYVSFAKDIRKVKKEIDELQNVISTNEESFRKIYDKHFSLISFNDFNDYAMKSYKAYEKYQRALKGNKESVADKALMEYNNVFPSIYISSTGLSHEEVCKKLYECGNAWKIKEKSQALIDKRNDKLKNLNINNIGINDEVVEYSRDYILETEKNILGFYASGHPLDSYKTYIERNASVLIGSVDETLLKTNVILVGRIKGFNKVYTKKNNEEMCVFTLEDLTGEIDVVCFPKRYINIKSSLYDDAIIVASGQIQDNSRDNKKEDEDGEVEFTPQLILNNVECAKLHSRVYIKVKNLFDWESIKETINHSCRGENELYVFFEDTKKWEKYMVQVTDADIIKAKLPDHEIIGK